MTPFGFAIVDKNGNFCEAYRNEGEARVRLARYERSCRNGPYRIIELYTKEQLDNSKAELFGALSDLSDMYSHAWDLVDGGLIMFQDSIPRFEKAHVRAASALEAAHGIVESSSDEKGDV